MKIIPVKRRHLLLAKVVNDKNGCTIPLPITVAPSFQIYGSATLSINRYLTVHAENVLEMLRKRKIHPEDQCILDILQLEELDIQFLDFGTVTSSRTPNERLLHSISSFKSHDFINHKRMQFLNQLASSQRRYRRASNYLKNIFTTIGRTDDVSRKVASVAALDTIINNIPLLASRTKINESLLLHKRNKQIAQELGDTVRDMLGWKHTTITAESGTYLNAHLSILAGARPGSGGGLNFSTNETGGNAPRAAHLHYLHFGSDQAGRDIDHSKETPIFADGRSPGLVYTAAIRDENAQLHWGRDKTHHSFGDYMIAELKLAIGINKKRNSLQAFRIVITIADRTKTAGLIGINDFLNITEYIATLKNDPLISKVYLIIDGCQSRGESLKGIYYENGPIAYYESKGVNIDGISWTSSKGPGGTPFAAGLTLRDETYQDLRAAIEDAEQSCSLECGFVAKYIKQGDFPAPENKKESIIEERAIADFAHHLRLLGDIPRLWRWANVYSLYEKTISDIKNELSKAISGKGQYFQALENESDPSVLNLRINRKQIPPKVNLTTIAKLLRLGFDLNKLKYPARTKFSSMEKAAALIATPTGQTVEERVSAEVFGDSSLPAMDDRITHEPIIRFAINLELAEAIAYGIKKQDEIILKLAFIINTRIRLILQHYDELSSHLSDIENKRIEAEDVFYNAPPENRYYDEVLQGFATNYKNP